MGNSANRYVVPLLVLVGLLSFGIAAYAATELGILGPPAFSGSPYADSPPAPEFTLPDHRGGTTSLADYRGRAVLLFFGFTRCPDFCPMTLAKLSRLLDETGLGPDRVAILMVTVEPEYDTPERLAAYLERFGPAATGLTGNQSEIEALFADYGVFAQPTTTHGGEPSLAHTTQVFGIDAAGRLRVLIHADEPDEVVGRDVRALAKTAR
jgi:protein SCO1/2